MDMQDYVDYLESRVAQLEETVYRIGVPTIAKSASIRDKEGITVSLMNSNSMEFTETLLPDVLRLSEDVDLGAVDLMNADRTKLNPNLYDGGSGGLPDGLSYSEENGLGIRSSAKKIFYVNPTSLELNESMNLFNSLKKIDDSLYNDGGLPKGLDYTKGILTIHRDPETNCAGINIEDVFRVDDLEDGAKGNVVIESLDGSYKIPTVKYITVNETGLDTTNNVLYTLDDNAKTCVCEGYQGTDKTALTKYEEFSENSIVRRRDPNASYEKYIKYVLVRINTDAFSECKNMEIEGIPKTVKELGNNAFKNCSKVNLPVLPPKTTKIGEEAQSGAIIPTVLELPCAVKHIGANYIKESIGGDTIDITKCEVLDSSGISENAFSRKSGNYKLKMTPAQKTKLSSRITETSGVYYFDGTTIVEISN